MEAFKTIIWIINIFSSLSIIILVLMQNGKGADAGASFGSGSGSAQGVFGSAGNANFLTRLTGICAAVFFASCLALSYVHSHSGKTGTLDFSDVQQTTTTQPVTGTTTAPASVASPAASSAQ
ncbi:preprotein translocase subunit SecG [Kingella kingae]|uniref:preprotein translocase subunit SecG n=1 Tax=Kingella kingae TaxID=504 RepID=UPI0004102160|nr:preprotein translocase subunit SecG [Kingella kingae]MDK4535648.1 preprotein translocase subunit SecG [Kingella kingae]MDK4538137.1 preprotein translocase subunit SecG [Kingella kingae]MDK4545124.1 preprotein translocase subunit SecG [Kingella kingae]MDK4546957.1 preprotein translocase subunit SecG [Kingella kingae]MDK4567150.1 preprotein translocase subunit SecG [Kingella kingae]